MAEAVIRRGADASDVPRGGGGTETEPSPVSPHEPLPAVELVGISKIFGSTVAAKNVSFELFPGEVLALVGENGAGKSTLVKTVGGVYRPDEGYLRIAGERVELHSPLDAQHRGIAVVHQHPGLFPDLSIAENVFAGQPIRGAAGLLDHGEMRAEAQKWIDVLGLRRDAGALVSQPADLRAADGGDRPGAGGRRQGADPGRADRGADHRRGRETLRGDRRAPHPRGGDDVRRPPDGGDLRGLRPDRHPSRRHPDRHPHHRRDRPGRDRQTDGRPRAGRALPPAPGGHRRPGADRREPLGGRIFQGHRVHRPGRRGGRPGRPGRQRPDRDRPGDLRYRQADHRFDHPRRRDDPPAVGRRRHGARHRLRLRGPARTEHHRGLLDPGQRHPAGDHQGHEVRA